MNQPAEPRDPGKLLKAFKSEFGASPKTFTRNTQLQPEHPARISAAGAEGPGAGCAARWSVPLSCGGSSAGCAEARTRVGAAFLGLFHFLSLIGRSGEMPREGA